MTNQVHTTNDYSLFSSIHGNRTVNNLHIERLNQSISKNYLHTIITVNESMQIIDGQHRFEVIKFLGLPLNYVVCEGYGLDEVHILNQNNRAWKIDDYLDGYIELDNINYVTYKDFKDKYNLTHSQCISMLSGHNGNANSHIINIFRDGKFKVTHLKTAKQIADNLLKIKDFYDGYKRNSFVKAIIKCMNNDKFNFNEFLHKVSLNPTLLQDCSNTNQYLSLIETIYNHYRKEKVNLRF